MSTRLVKLDELQFLTCLKHNLWGSKSARFKDWSLGDCVVFVVNKALAGLAEVSGQPMHSKQKVWDNGVFPHRIPVRFSHVLLPDNRPPVLGEIRDALTTAWGPRYGWGILNQSVLPDIQAEAVMKAIRTRPNSLMEFVTDLENRMVEARTQRETLVVPRSKGRPRKAVEREDRIEPVVNKEEESRHSKNQSLTIRLGKVAGCSTWIASNDRNRMYKGKTLGDGCLKSLPNLGLSTEATNRISLIDVIWIRQNAPVCAFEVETTTSVYSGLLRMSDLLSVVPALNIKLYIIAPRVRQDKVMGELSRPTFQKIGLNDFCRFIADEDLDVLFSKLEGLEGHIHPSIIDTIAVELEDELPTEAT